MPKQKDKTKSKSYDGTKRRNVKYPKEESYEYPKNTKKNTNKKKNKNNKSVEQNKEKTEIINDNLKTQNKDEKCLIENFQSEDKYNENNHSKYTKTKSEDNKITDLELTNLNSELEIIINDKEIDYNYNVILSDLPRNSSKDNKQKENNSEKGKVENDNIKDLKDKIEENNTKKKDFIRESLPKKRKDDNEPGMEKIKYENNELLINKEIETNYLELIDPVYEEINNEILYYRKIKFQGKKFTLFTKKSETFIYNNLYYYCTNHRTTKSSSELDNKGFKKRVCIYVMQK